MTLYNTDDSVLVGAPAGSGKTVCAEFAMLRALSKPNFKRIVYVAPLEDIAKVIPRSTSESFLGLVDKF